MQVDPYVLEEKLSEAYRLGQMKSMLWTIKVSSTLLFVWLSFHAGVYAYEHGYLQGLLP